MPISDGLQAFEAFRTPTPHLTPTDRLNLVCELGMNYSMVIVERDSLSALTDRGRHMVHHTIPAERQGPVTVLIIDDNHHEREYWAAALKTLPFAFIVLDAGCGESGFRLCHSRQVDCVVLDLEMPESGLYTLLRLIPDPTRQHTAVVILTKLVQPGLMKLMKGFGAHECLVKEYCSAEKLANTIWEAIAAAKSKRAVSDK